MEPTQEQIDAGEFLDIVFDGPPSHESGRFVEVESPPGRGIKCGEWLPRDGFWVLRIPNPAIREAAARREEQEMCALACQPPDKEPDHDFESDNHGDTASHAWKEASWAHAAAIRARGKE